MELRHPALEHGSTRAGRWLRERRLRLAFGIALVEAILIVFDAIPSLTALLVGALILAFYFGVGRHARSDTLRQASWTAALSQVLVAFVPVVTFVVGALVVVAVAVAVIVGLFVLLRDRR